MAVLGEVLGLMVPGSSSIPAGDERSAPAARRAGELIVAAVAAGGRRPTDILTPAAFANAVVALHAIGGSTNAVIHLAALAGRAAVAFPLEDIARLGAGVPLLADIQPSGAQLMPDFDAAGGVPSLLREISGLLDLDAMTITGQAAR